MPDEAQELPFPLAGVDVSCEVDRQTPRTTPLGVNVRACDPGTLRMRGAARAGLTKLVDETVSGAVGFPVQHLNVIVDPTVDALLTTFELWDAPGTGGPRDGVDDPSTNNAAGGDTDPDNPLVRNPRRRVRPGGSGIQINRRKDQRTPPPPPPPPSPGFTVTRTYAYHPFYGSSTPGNGELPAPWALTTCYGSLTAPTLSYGVGPGGNSGGGTPVTWPGGSLPTAVELNSQIVAAGFGQFNPDVIGYTDVVGGAC